MTPSEATGPLSSPGSNDSSRGPDLAPYGDSVAILWRVASPLVDTKLLVPRTRASIVPRPRLDERLRLATDARLTLISAPAGFGKTTLLAAWAEAHRSVGGVTAWVSLEPSDDDPITFWRYVTAALARAVPSLAATATMLEGAESPPIPTILATLVNQLAAAPTDLTLVLDDYHAITSPEIQEQMTFLIEHLPTRIHLVIATRADPPFPLARLRARGDLVEIRAADLRFTTHEATTYLNERMGLGLGPRDIDALEGRTEGWIAALQLAALAMQGRDDVSAYIASYTGDDRFVVDHLVEEVLRRQSDEVREFLLRSSILDRLSAALCDAVTGQHDGRATLDALDRGNLFLVPLDDGRRWFRYHHLFADMLRARLLDERPGLVRALHRRASAWFEVAGDRDEAVRHALEGQDWDRAAHLLELALPDLRQGRQEALMRRWLGALPRETFQDRPVLAIGYVGGLMSDGEPQDIEALLADAERWLDPRTRPESGLIVADQSQLARLPSAITMYRAAQAQIRGDREATLAQATRALELAAPDDHSSRGGAAGFLALVQWAAGDLDAAHDHWTRSMDSLTRAGHLVDAVAIVRALAEIRAAQGQAREARRTYEHGLDLASGHGPNPLRGAADMHTGLAELAVGTNDLDTAAAHLLASTQLDGQGAALPQDASRRRVVSALIRHAEGDADAALALLDEAERTYVGEYFPVFRPIPALRARMLIAERRLAEAADWARDRGLAPEDDLDPVREYEHVTLARLLMASATTAETSPMRRAQALLDRLLRAAEAGGRQRSVLEVRVLLAIVRDALRDDVGALSVLCRAFELAEPEDQVRVFLAEGARMTALLERAIAHGISPRFARRLLAASDRPRKQPLAESLSERELEVLDRLATDMSGPDIARELVVALSTVRSHTKSIYNKLGVSGRRAAVRRAEDLGLLSGARRP